MGENRNIRKGKRIAFMDKKLSKLSNVHLPFDS